MSKTDATFGNGVNLLTLANNKGLSKEAFDDLNQTGLLADLFEAANAGQLKVVDREAFRWLMKLTPLNPPLLELVSTAVVSATTSKFVAKDRFVVNTERNAPVKISGVWENFTNWFLSGDGKIEDPESEQTLRYAKLRKASVDGPIITELGGEAKAETTLSEMFSLMEKQKNGEDDALLNNGWANIFYVKDIAGVLRAVYVGWYGDGWSVAAGSVESPCRWIDGHQVFSRNSVLESSEPSAPAQA